MIFIRRGVVSLFALLVALIGLTLPAQSVASVLPGGTVTATYAAGAGAFVTVQVNGHEYVFIVDTGASTSAVTSKAATTLGLIPAGPARSVTTIGCRTAVRPAEIAGWRVGDVALPPTPIAILNNSLSSEKLGRTPVSGLLGSEVLSQFGTVTFDLARKHLVLGGRAANPRAGIPMKVVRSQGGVAEIVRATINRRPSSYLLDTGSPLTLLSASAASRSGLVSLPGSIKVHGAAGCSLKAHVTHIFAWSAGGQPLPSTPALTVPIGIKFSKKGPAIGLIGAQTLFGFGRLTMDFTHSRLILGSPARQSRSTPALSAVLSDRAVRSDPKHPNRRANGYRTILRT